MGIHKGYTEQDYRAKADAGLSLSETARELGVAPASVHTAAKKYGITFTRKYMTKERRSLLMEDKS